MAMDEMSEAEDLRSLTQRVAELERMVAELRLGATPVVEPQSTLVERKPFVPAAAPPPPPMPSSTITLPELLSVAPVPKKSLEDRIGTQGLNLVGIVAVMVGAAFGLKLAIDNGLLGPVARVLIGLAAGAGVVVWSERFRRRGLAAFSYSLKAVGSGILYLSLWASFQLYHELPAAAALVAMLLVTAWNAYMAWSQDSELLAGYALAGGFATPLLLATGGNHETFLLTYVGMIALATVVLLRFKPWNRLLVPAFVASVAYLAGWFVEWFHTGMHLFTSGAATSGWDGESTETAVFALAFFAIFACVSVKGWARYRVPESDVLGQVLLPLANAAFVACALYAVFEESGLHADRAWLMVGLAAVLLGLMRVQRTRVAGAVQLAAAVVCLTAAIPLKASAHTLTTAWLVEGLVLYWVSTRFEEENRAPARVLTVLSLGGYVLGLGALVATWAFSNVSGGFFDADHRSAWVAVVVLAGAVWVARRTRADADARPEIVAWMALVSAAAVGLLLAVPDIAADWLSASHVAFLNPQFGSALLGLAVIAGCVWAGLRLAQDERFGTLRMLAAGASVLFHLVAILSVEQEIRSLFTSADAGVQRSLAISGFLMAYGAVLLGLGFWRRIAFVRWQALVLLLFTICKVFLYDTLGLSAGYRVVSFMGLGVLLLGVSYAYQKDWLGLKEPASLDKAGGV